MQSSVTFGLSANRAKSLRSVVCTSLREQFLRYFAVYGRSSVKVVGCTREALGIWTQESDHDLLFCDFAASKLAERPDALDVLRVIRHRQAGRQPRIYLMADVPDAQSREWGVDHLGAVDVIGRTPRDVAATIAKEEKRERETAARAAAVNKLAQVDVLFHRFAGPAADSVIASVADDLDGVRDMLSPGQYAALLASVLTTEHMRNSFLQTVEHQFPHNPFRDTQDVDSDGVPVLKDVLKAI